MHGQQQGERAKWCGLWLFVVPVIDESKRFNWYSGVLMSFVGGNLS